MPAGRRCPGITANFVFEECLGRLRVIESARCAGAVIFDNPLQCDATTTWNLKSGLPLSYAGLGFENIVRNADPARLRYF